ncbi:hypothetical protein DFJ73DRAFT_128113 [Zopfochytrium polystomum]|nr:hypothetical protein DFJ73DRAFT_128113 [Zopfochytrium polystomum]
MLKRHLACIDLEKNCLRINNEEIAFLPEHELPDQARELPAASSSSSGESAASPRANASSSLSSPSRTGGAGAGAGDSTAAPPAAAASPGSPAHASSVQGAGGVGGAGAAGAAAGGAIAGGGGASRFPEASIRGLMDLGVSRAEAIMALEQCNGDTDVAASLLFG